MGVQEREASPSSVLAPSYVVFLSLSVGPVLLCFSSTRKIRREFVANCCLFQFFARSNSVLALRIALFLRLSGSLLMLVRVID